MMIEAVKFEPSIEVLANLSKSSGEITYSWKPPKSARSLLLSFVGLFCIVAFTYPFLSASPFPEVTWATFPGVLIAMAMRLFLAACVIYYGTTFAWGLFGSLQLVATKEKLTTITRLGPFSRKRHYQANAISNIRWVDSHRKADPEGTLDMPSTLRFDYGGKTVKLFDGIDEPEAVGLISELEDTLQIKRASE
jgi:fatty acid desaturase